MHVDAHLPPPPHHHHHHSATHLAVPGAHYSSSAGGTSMGVGKASMSSSNDGYSNSVAVGGAKAEVHGVKMEMDPALKAGLAAAAAVTAVAGIATAVLLEKRRKVKKDAGVVDSPACAICKAAFGALKWRHACLHCCACRRCARGGAARARAPLAAPLTLPAPLFSLPQAAPSAAAARPRSASPWRASPT